MPWKKGPELPFAILAAFLCWGSFAWSLWSASNVAKDSKKSSTEKKAAIQLVALMAVLALIMTIGSFGNAFSSNYPNFKNNRPLVPHPEISQWNARQGAYKPAQWRPPAPRNS